MDLLPGELILHSLPGNYITWTQNQLNETSALNSDTATTLTNFRLFYQAHDKQISIALPSISHIEKSQKTLKITITQKFNPTKTVLRIHKKGHYACSALIIELCSFRKMYIEDTFALRNYRQQKAENNQEEALILLNELVEFDISIISDIEFEFKRMCFDTSQWVISDLNSEYGICQTYPKQNIAPKSFFPIKSQYPGSFPGENDSDFDAMERMRELSSYRVKNRHPFVCWKNPCFHQVLIRSSQPLTGILGNRNLEDEAFINEIVNCVKKEYKSNHCHHRRILHFGDEDDNDICDGDSSFDIDTLVHPFCIFDCRPFSSALGNNVFGGGYENVQNYPSGTKLDFLGLPNIHVIAACHSAMLKEIGENNFNGEKCQEWITEISEVLCGCNKIVEQVVEGSSLLIRCSDGWDRTSQCISLAQIMLDPFYRTIQGLCILLNREWFMLGHPFASRLDHPTTTRILPSLTPTPNLLSPIFLLFLSSLRQLISQNPTSFEYSDSLLLLLAYVSTNGESTLGIEFFFNSDNERHFVDGIYKGILSDLSVWKFIQGCVGSLRNVGYKKPNSSCICGKRKIASFGNESNDAASETASSCTDGHCCFANYCKTFVIRFDGSKEIEIWKEVYSSKKPDFQQHESLDRIRTFLKNRVKNTLVLYYEYWKQAKMEKVEIKDFTIIERPVSPFHLRSQKLLATQRRYSLTSFLANSLNGWKSGTSGSVGGKAEAKKESIDIDGLKPAPIPVLEEGGVDLSSLHDALDS